MSSDDGATPLYCLYGSATGNAEEIAKDLAATYESMIQNPDVTTKFPSVVCCELDQFKRNKCLETWGKEPSSSSKQIKHGVVVVISTTGNGEPPENAGRFVRFLSRKTTPTDTLQHVSFSVLGLGDTNYDQFCNAGKVLDKKMAALGGTRAKPLACADEATGLEQVCEPWTESILTDITKACFSDFNSGDDSKTTDNPVPVLKGGRKDTETTISQESPSTQQPAANVPSTPPPEKSDAPLFCLYGSATGNCEQIAKDLAATYEMLLKNPDAKTFFPSVVCCELDQFKKRCTQHWETAPNGGRTKHGVIIVVSSTGNGDPPENCGRFFRYISRKNTQAEQPFKHCAFAVLGLGDTNYDQFCNVGKIIDKKLELLGGTRVKPIACADEATGLEEVVDPWTSTILSDITEAARCVGNGGGETTTAAPRSPEGKTVAFTENPVSASLPTKEETTVDDVPKRDSTTTSNGSSVGLQAVRSLIGIAPNEPMITVEITELPSLASSRSSCELFKDDDEEDLARMDELTRRRRRASSLGEQTISTSSSAASHYTVNHPFESTILSARYLSNTPADAASEIMELVGPNGSIQSDSAILSTREILDKKFPLTPDVAPKDELTEQGNLERNGKRVLEMELSLPEDFTLEYQPGDAVGFVITNTPEAVQFVLNMLRDRHGIQASQRVSIDANKPITVEETVRCNIDLCSPIKKKRLLYNLSHHATDEDEISALQFLSSKKSEGERVFQEYVIKQRRSVYDLLIDFPSLQNIDLNGLLSILPGIPPRYYSVSSSPLDQRHTSPPSLTVAFSVVDYLTPSLVLQGDKEIGHRRVYGIATRYLEAICSPFLVSTKITQNGSSNSPTIKLFPKPTTEFRLPANISTPMILIGPGTGIAPFMGFLAHRRAQLLSKETPTDAANAVVEGTWRGDYEIEAPDLTVGSKDAGGLVLGVDYRNKQEAGSVDVFYGTFPCLLRF